jgi:hypothetical protein
MEAEQAAETQKDLTESSQSTFMSRLITKMLDNIQVHLERIHLRIEDSISDLLTPYACGITLEEMIIQSADATWNYTLQVRENATSACLLKKFEVKKLGLYWSCTLEKVLYKYIYMASYQRLSSRKRHYHNSIVVPYDAYIYIYIMWQTHKNHVISVSSKVETCCDIFYIPIRA